MEWPTNSQSRQVYVPRQSNPRVSAVAVEDEDHGEPMSSSRYLELLGRRVQWLIDQAGEKEARRLLYASPIHWSLPLDLSEAGETLASQAVERFGTTMFGDRSSQRPFPAKTSPSLQRVLQHTTLEEWLNAMTPHELT